MVDDCDISVASPIAAVIMVVIPVMPLPALDDSDIAALPFAAFVVVLIVHHFDLIVAVTIPALIVPLGIPFPDVFGVFRIPSDHPNTVEVLTLTKVDGAPEIGLVAAISVVLLGVAVASVISHYENSISVALAHDNGRSVVAMFAIFHDDGGAV